MSETGLPIPATDAESGPSAGALLRRAREGAGLHIAALAVSLKVPVRKIEALEADRWEELPDSAFVRALAASVCRSLRVDPNPVLALLPIAAPTRLRDMGSLHGAALSSGNGNLLASAYRLLARPAGLALLLLLAALLVYLWPAGQPATPPQAASSSESGIAPSGTVASPAVPVLATPLVEPAQPLPAVKSASAPLAATPAPAPPAPAPAMVAFKAKGSSWVEVVDARQVILLRRTLGAGESASAEGAAPLTVVIGRADATEVLVRGRALDISGLSKDNVARFEVK